MSTTFTATPSIERLAALTVRAAAEPAADGAVGYLVASGDGPAPAGLRAGRDALAAAGFDASAGSTLVVTVESGPSPVAVGLGSSTTVEGVRDAAAAFARAARGHRRLTLSLEGLDGVGPAAAAQAAVEGVVLARYAYDELRGAPKGAALDEVIVLAAPEQLADAAAGAATGQTFAAATSLARDLANSPHSHLSASRFAALAVGLGPQRGLEVEVFEREALVALGCGGLLGVNAGSVEPPAMIKLTYRPEGAAGKRLALVGKGVMYDSGGLALKPGDEVHAQMKNDMSGAAAVFAAMCALGDVGCPNTVTAWLMCTDNMPSGTAMALGDVITIHGGTTVEVVNTDAEGRLVMADALVLAREEGHDAIVDVATLTGACMRALGTKVAGVMGNDQPLVEQLKAAAAATDEPIWQLPLDARYRSELDSPIADLRNLGGANAGAITAALFLAEFVGDTPWAHLDIAGTAQSTGDAGWQTAGCTGFGARTLLQLALDFGGPR